ncbi:MAG: hypothetical protein IKV92_00685 [Akkermansia sp.]|nr:hypothetical protein [Akkermansia sp.]MBR5876411.1 hypothetical protein [Akkermansia sp.]
MKQIKISILVITVILFSAFIYTTTRLFCTDIHLTCIDGKVCPCEIGRVQETSPNQFRIYIPKAAGETLYVDTDSLYDGALSIDAYVLPWFGRIQVKPDDAGYAVISK